MEAFFGIGLGAQRAQLPEFPAASYPGPLSVAQLAGTGFDSGRNFPAEGGLAQGPGPGSIAGVGAVRTGRGARQAVAGRAAPGRRTPRASAPPAGTQRGLAL